MLSETIQQYIINARMRGDSAEVATNFGRSCCLHELQPTRSTAAGHSADTLPFQSPVTSPSTSDIRLPSPRTCQRRHLATEQLQLGEGAESEVGCDAVLFVGVDDDRDDVTREKMKQEADEKTTHVYVFTTENKLEKYSIKWSDLNLEFSKVKLECLTK